MTPIIVCGNLKQICTLYVFTVPEMLYFWMVSERRVQIACKRNLKVNSERTVNDMWLQDKRFIRRVLGVKIAHS